jgi:hypothetical protein
VGRRFDPDRAHNLKAYFLRPPLIIKFLKFFSFSMLFQIRFPKVSMVFATEDISKVEEKFGRTATEGHRTRPDASDLK